MKAYKEYRQLNSIASTRIKLGLSQEMFAIELGVSRSAVSKAENKTRSLPTAALLKLAALELSLAAEASDIVQSQYMKSLVKPETGPTAFKLFNTRTGNLREEISRLLEKQNHLESEYEKLQTALAQVKLMEADEGTATGRFDPSYLPIRKYKLLRRLNRCGPDAQQALRSKILMHRMAAILEGEFSNEVIEQLQELASQKN